MKNDPRGFSLIEILLVLVLLAVVTGLTVPRFGPTVHNLALQRAAQDLGYLMRYGQSRAVNQQELVRLQFDDTYQVYWLTQEAEDLVSEEEGTFERVSGRMGRPVTIPDGINVEAPGSNVTFYPDGRIEKCLLRLCRAQRCYVVSTGAQRGKVLVFEEESIN